MGDFAAEAEPEREPGSYRDRNGSVFYRDGEVFRGVSAAALRNWERLSAAPFFAARTADGSIVRTERRSPASGTPDERWAAILRHDRVPVVSYPYEWTFGMLKDAALLHLDLMRDALGEGMILKDASPYNVQWNGARPVFIDIPSFEILGDGQPWVAYRQFCELFLYPLMLRAYKGVDFRPLLRGSLDGVPAAAMRPLMSSRDLLRPGVFLHVAAQNALQRRYSGGGNVRGALAKSGFGKELIVRNVEGLRATIAKMRPAGERTVWADYARTHSYDDAAQEAKRDFVRRAVAGHRPLRRVWDLGCNTGAFSRIAAEHCDCVVAMDGDWMAIERLYREQQDRPDARRILPLVINLADPSPAQGWRGLERRPLDRRGLPDLTLCLALIHHMVIGANIPMADFLGWLKALGTAVVIEFVGRHDEMVQALLAAKDERYDDYDQANFEALLRRDFDVRASSPLKDGKRTIYYAVARSSIGSRSST